jgi:hypothetical protein
MTGRRWALVASGIILVVVSVFVARSYLQYQEHAELRKRLLPFVEVVVLGIADAEAELERKGALVPPAAKQKEGVPPPTRPACGLDTCADVQKSSIAGDGTVEVVLSGKRQPELDGKIVVLSPVVTNGVVAWTCRTNAPARFVPAQADSLPFWPTNVKHCAAL